MLDFHGELPPRIGSVSFDQEALENERGDRAASRVGKLTAHMLLANGTEPAVARSIIEDLTLHETCPYPVGSDELHFFHQSAVRVVEAKTREGVAA